MIKAVLVLAATLAFAAGAYLVTFTGFQPDQFPVPQVDPPVQPAGYAFAIWGVIFLWLLASAVFGVTRRADDQGWERVRWPLTLSVGIGATWNAVANASALAATLLIWVMLVAALIALLRAPETDRPWLAWPVGLYAGWLTAASSVAMGLLAAGYGLAGDDAVVAMAAVVLAALIALVILAQTANPAYALAVIWALVALVAKNSALPWVAGLAGGAALLLIGALTLTLRARAKG